MSINLILKKENIQIKIILIKILNFYHKIKITLLNMNNNINSINNTVNNLNKTNFSYDNSDEQLQVGVKIILNAFENKIAFFEKEISNLKEALKIKEERTAELESLLENVSEDLKKCQEFNTNLIDENKYLVDLTEKLNEDNGKLTKFKNNILASLQLDSNFILNQDNNNLNLNSIFNNNQKNTNNQNTDDFEKSRQSPNLFNPYNLIPNKNFVSFNARDQANIALNDFQNLNSQSSRNFQQTNHQNKNQTTFNHVNPNNLMSYNNINFNNSNLNSILSPLNQYESANDLSNHNIESGSHINDMIKNLQNKMKVNSNLEKERFNNTDFNYNNNYEETKEIIADKNSNNLGSIKSSKITNKISELKNKFKNQKYEKFYPTEGLTTLNNNNNSDGNSKKEHIENTLNLSKEKTGKSHKYQQSIKFFNEARVILKKEEFDELVFLIKSINQGKVTSDDFDTKINLLIGNHPSLIRDLPNVINFSN